MTSVDPTLRTAPDPVPAAAPAAVEDPAPDPAWRRALLAGGVAYVLSRLLVMGAAGAIGAAREPRPETALRPMIDAFTTWDGRWYMAIVRDGYPRSVVSDVTYEDHEARAAFFPGYPLLVQAVDRVLPGGDVLAALGVNLVLGALFVFLVGVIARKVRGPDVARRAMILTALFPGSFVLSYAYSEALMLCLAAGCLLALMDRRWVLAGVLAGLATATRPNAMALVAACAVVAFVAWRRDRDWRALVAPVLAPLGFVAFQIFLGAHADEAGVWFRVQREAWDEGASFGWTAVRDLAEFVTDPFGSATNVLTVLCVLATIAGVYALWRAKLPLPIVVYTAVVLVLMLAPATVTARPRFLFTAFPILIAVAAIWPDDDRDWWPMLLSACGGGLSAVVVLYGLFAAIP